MAQTVNPKLFTVGDSGGIDCAGVTSMAPNNWPGLHGLEHLGR